MYIVQISYWCAYLFDASEALKKAKQKLKKRIKIYLRASVVNTRSCRDCTILAGFIINDEKEHDKSWQAMTPEQPQNVYNNPMKIK